MGRREAPVDRPEHFGLLDHPHRFHVVLVFEQVLAQEVREVFPILGVAELLAHLVHQLGSGSGLLFDDPGLPRDDELAIKLVPAEELFVECGVRSES